MPTAALGVPSRKICGLKSCRACSTWLRACATEGRGVRPRELAGVNDSLVVRRAGRVPYFLAPCNENP